MVKCMLMVKMLGKGLKNDDDDDDIPLHVVVIMVWLVDPPVINISIGLGPMDCTRKGLSGRGFWGVVVGGAVCGGGDGLFFFCRWFGKLTVSDLNNGMGI